MPRINPIRKNGKVTPEAKLTKTPTDKPVNDPAPESKIFPVDFVPALPLWKQRTTVIPRFTIP